MAITAWAVVLSAVAHAAPAAAQDSTRTSPDSLAARLERAEQVIAFMQQQLADASQTAVRTRSRASFELTGRVLVNGYSNSRSVNSLDVPLFVRLDTLAAPGYGPPLSTTAYPQRGVGMGIRQTTLGFAITVPDVLGGNFTGDLETDFFGGQYGGTATPLLHLRIARATVRWNQAEVSVGQDAPLISALSPVSLAAVGVPGFSATGNLWAWLPQVRAGVETGGSVRLGVQGAVLAPTVSNEPAATENDAAGSSGRPFLEARTHVRWGSDEMAADIGVGGHLGWLSTPNSSALRKSQGIGVDALVPLTPWVSVRGEWYAGDAMSVLGGGAIGQLFGVSGAPIHSMGGWGQVNFTPSPMVVVGAGYGMDDPDDTDLPAGGRRKNSATEVHLHLRPGGPIVVGFEYRRMQTTYASGPLTNDHLNVAVGFVF